MAENQNVVCFQSDIIHQSALELIHSEDREEFKKQLSWRSQVPPDQPDMTLQQVLLPGEAPVVVFLAGSVSIPCSIVDSRYMVLLG